ncbi:MAG TPA: ATPase [Firmicutes bacterium]|nr:ATPase [Bacillota bacterium]
MIIALPLTGDQLSQHFGHCERFAFYEVDPKKKKINSVKYLVPPPHEPGILPPWIKKQGASLVITAGIGMRAQGLFEAAGVKVITGAPAQNPSDVVNSFLDNSLETGHNTCDH